MHYGLTLKRPIQIYGWAIQKLNILLKHVACVPCDPLILYRLWVFVVYFELKVTHRYTVQGEEDNKCHGVQRLCSPVP